jgi:hypothetical protein
LVVRVTDRGRAFPSRLLEVPVFAFVSRLFRRPGTGEPAWIDVGELRRRLATGTSVALVDVRGPDEFNTPPGHLPDAINIPLPELRRSS